MHDSPEISFVIPAYNEALELPLTLTCLHQAARCQSHFNYEVIVCDNNSTDRTAEIAQAHDAKIAHEEIRQISRSRNAGAEIASGSWLIFLDADTRINQRLLNAVLTKIRGGRFGLLGSIVRFDIDDLKFFPALVVTVWNVVSAMTGLAAGSFIACPRHAFVQIGGFHQDFYAGEEIEFSLRMHRWCRQHHLNTAVEILACVITSGRKIRGRSTWEMFKQLSVLFPGALKSKTACGFWYNDQWR